MHLEKKRHVVHVMTIKYAQDIVFCLADDQSIYPLAWQQVLGRSVIGDLHSVWFPAV